MVGGGGVTTLFDYLQSSSEASGLGNSTSRGGSAFYTHRLSDRQYFGASYQYSEVAAKPTIVNGIAEGDLNSNNIFGFYSVYLRSNLSLSFGGGSQRYVLTQAGAAPAAGWAPSATGSLGWQGLHTSFAVSYSRLYTEGEGVIGLYSANSAAVSGRWQLSRNWTSSLGGNYSAIATVAGSSAGSISGGHTLSGAASVGRQLGQNLGFTFQYQRLSQNYPGIAAISGDPDTSRASVSITYHFLRPLGR